MFFNNKTSRLCLISLLLGGSDINWTTHEGETALLLACKRRQGSDANAFVNLLLQYGANPNIVDNEEDSPLLEGLLCTLFRIFFLRQQGNY